MTPRKARLDCITPPQNRLLLRSFRELQLADLSYLHAETSTTDTTFHFRGSDAPRSRCRFKHLLGSSNSASEIRFCRWLKRDSSFPSSAAESCATASPISSAVRSSHFFRAIAWALDPSVTGRCSMESSRLCALLLRGETCLTAMAPTRRATIASIASAKRIGTVVGDKAYDADWIRAQIKEQGAVTTFRTRPTGHIVIDAKRPSSRAKPHRTL
jgi:hypothetical protein